MRRPRSPGLTPPTLAASAASADDGSDSALPLVMSGAALVVSLLTALLVWRRGRPAHGVASGTSRELEDARR